MPERATAERARKLVAIASASVLSAALAASLGGALPACSWSLEGFSGGADPDSGRPVDAALGGDGGGNPGSDGGAGDADAGASASLSVDARNEAAAAYDLTALGPLDWAQFTKTLTVRCASCVHRIGTLAFTAPGIGYNDDIRTMTWENGAPTATGSTQTGIFVVMVGHAFDLDVAAAPVPALLTVHADTYRAAGSLDVRVDGAQVAPQHVDLPEAEGGVAYAIQVRFSGPVGSSLHFTYTLTKDLVPPGGMETGNIAIIAATLAAASP